ncbi:uncharacterized protein LOC134671619 [Cydia fagiglandana]|uniref:uncharacterized protein LOC134671619 n=1 Tax=Cydia fagiglandana TaxID=1458189 RepID=UPI002FEE3036
MCYKGNFLHRIQIEWVCLAVAIFDAIGSIVLLGFYGCVWFMILAMSETETTWRGIFGGGPYRGWIPEVFIYVILPFVVLVNLIFSILLCNGICQRRPRPVKVYFYFGVAITALAALLCVVLFSCDSDQLGLHFYTDPDAVLEFRIAKGLWLLFGCVLHSELAQKRLMLVQQTLKKLEERESFDPVHLQEFNTKQEHHV